MFGLAPFNRTSFDRPYSLDTYFVADIEIMTETISRLTMDAVMAAEIESVTELNSSMIREIPTDAIIESITEVSTTMIREFMRNVNAIETVTEFNADVTRTHVDSIRFNGNFNPGDRLIIDTKKQTITLNGVNVLHLFDGDFFALVYGPNEIKYTDGESGRNILTRITHRDRYLY